MDDSNNPPAHIPYLEIPDENITSPNSGLACSGGYACVN